MSPTGNCLRNKIIDVNVPFNPKFFYYIYIQIILNFISQAKRLRVLHWKKLETQRIQRWFREMVINMLMEKKTYIQICAYEDAWKPFMSFIEGETVVQIEPNTDIKLKKYILWEVTINKKSEFWAVFWIQNYNLCPVIDMCFLCCVSIIYKYIFIYLFLLLPVSFRDV